MSSIELKSELLGRLEPLSAYWLQEHTPCAAYSFGNYHVWPCNNVAEVWMSSVPVCRQHAAKTVSEFLTSTVAGYIDSQRNPEYDFAEAQREGLVYYAERQGFVKVGKSNNPASRLRALALGGVTMPPGVTPGPLSLLATHSGGRKAEQAIHHLFRADWVAGEWFRMSEALTRHIVHINARRQAVAA